MFRRLPVPKFGVHLVLGVVVLVVVRVVPLVVIPPVRVLVDLTLTP